MSRDPIDYEGGINLYAYAGNNPVTHADPSGLQAPVTVTTEKIAPVIVQHEEQDIRRRVLRQGAVNATEKFAVKRAAGALLGFVPVVGQLVRFAQGVDLVAGVGLGLYTASLDRQASTLARAVPEMMSLYARAKAKHPYPEIALGKFSQDLAGFAKTVGPMVTEFNTWSWSKLKVPRSSSNQGNLIMAAIDQAIKIHFNLNDVDTKAAMNNTGHYLTAEWELSYIARNPKLLAKTHFYSPAR